MTPITDRQKTILNQVVETHIDTAAPVGSEALRRRYGLKTSTATLRNEMCALEECGYLGQWHVSSGRVPTDRGYRHYVNECFVQETFANEVPHQIEDSLWSYCQNLDEPEAFMEGLPGLLASLTQETSIVYTVNPHNALVRYARLGLQNRRFYLQGSSYILDKPEFKDLTEVRLIFKALEEKDEFMEWMSERLEEENVTILIGSEIEHQAFQNCSIVAAPYSSAGEKAGTIALLGPTRMHYMDTVPLIALVARLVGEILDQKF